MPDRGTPSIDELFEKNKKSFTFFGLLAAIFVYGPRQCFEFLRTTADWLGERITDIIERFLISVLEIGVDIGSFLGDLIRIVARHLTRWFWISLWVTAVYWVMLTLGVALRNSIIIAITGIIVGLYFVVAAWILENAIYASVLGYDFSKGIINKILAAPRSLLERIGLLVWHERKIRPDGIS